jgi:drug/metabolite transporter (DMT)-like permease
MADGILLAILAALAFGAALVVTQRGLAHQSAYAGARISILTTALLLWLPAPWAFDARVLSSPALAMFAGVGLFFPLLVTLLTFEANRIMGPTLAGTLGSVAPLLSLTAAVLFLGEGVTARIAGAALAVTAGIALLSLQRAAQPQHWPLAALALPLAAAALRAGAQAWIKAGLALVPSAYTAALTGYTVSALAVWLLALPGGRLVQAGGWLPRFVAGRPGAAFSLRGGAWFMAAGVLNGSAVLAMYGALSQTGLAIVAPIVATYPVATLLLSAGLLRTERIGARRAAGCLLVVAGMVLILA